MSYPKDLQVVDAATALLKHIPSGVLCTPVTKLSDLMAANGVLVIVPNSPDASGAGCSHYFIAAGIDWAGVVAETTNVTDAVRHLIADNYGSGSTAMWAFNPPDAPSRRAEVRVALGWDNSGFVSNPSDTPQIGAFDIGSLKVYAVKNRLFSGTGIVRGADESFRSSRNGDSIPLGSSDSRSFASFQRQSMLEGVVANGTIRVPGGASYAARIQQYFDSLYAATDADFKPKLLPCIDPSIARVKDWMSGYGINLDESLDVYVPVVICTDGRVRIIPPLSPISYIDFYASGVPIAVGPAVFGAMVYDLNRDRHRTWPAVYTVGPQGAMCSSLRTAGDTPVSTRAAQAAAVQSWSEITSIDGVPIGYFVDWLAPNAYGHKGSTLTDSAKFTSASLWDMNRAAIKISDDITDTTRPLDPTTGQPMALPDYLAKMQATLANKKTAGGRNFSSSSWDQGIFGLSQLLAVCDLAMQPKKAQAWEWAANAPSAYPFVKFMDAHRYNSTPHNSATVDGVYLGGTAKMFTEQTGDINDAANG